ncbi:MAG TPA: CidA/LrgA family protein [Candidatus Methylacidiphilales bacterium]
MENAFRHARVAYRRGALGALLQLLVLVVLWEGCQRVVTACRLPLPAGVVGFFLLALALHLRWLSPGWVGRGANGLLNNLTLFFVPAMVALVSRRELMGVLGLKLLAAVVAGTLLVMATTACVIDYSLHREERKGEDDDRAS